jgi:hypothetical protein
MGVTVLPATVAPNQLETVAPNAVALVSSDFGLWYGNKEGPPCLPFWSNASPWNCCTECCSSSNRECARKERAECWNGAASSYRQFFEFTVPVVAASSAEPAPLLGTVPFLLPTKAGKREGICFGGRGPKNMGKGV